jgi:hypothetical protein
MPAFYPQRLVAIVGLLCWQLSSNFPRHFAYAVIEIYLRGSYSDVGLEVLSRRCDSCVLSSV